MTEDYVTDAVFEFLENGGELPVDASKNPQSRFVFQTAIAKQTYQKSCTAIKDAGEAKALSVVTEKDMTTLKTVVDTKMEALVDGVNVRLGLVGGIVAGPGAVADAFRRERRDPAQGRHLHRLARPRGTGRTVAAAAGRRERFGASCGRRGDGQVGFPAGGFGAH